MKFIILLLCIGFVPTTIFSVESVSKQGRFSTLYNEVIHSKSKLFYKSLKKWQDFESHIDLDKKYGTYLIHKVNFSPVNNLKFQIERSKGLVLKDRGEAHITVITPPEHDAIIAAGISGFSMETLENEYASEIQSLNWNVKGIGVAKGNNFAGIYTEVYFLVVRSYQLRRLRKEIAKKYKIPNDVFDPKKQDFHITIGFTVGDLFGIAKDESSLDPQLDLESMID